MKRYELLIHERTWVNLKGIVLNKINHCQRVLFCMISFVWHSQKDRTIMMEMGIARVRVGEGVTKGKVLRSFGAVYSPVSLLWWDLSLNVKVLVA